MAKRRTRRQKQTAKHQFKINWNEASAKIEFEPNVNRQIPKSTNTTENEPKLEKLAQFSAKNLNLSTIKKNIVRSLILATIILASELVLYFIWK